MLMSYVIGIGCSAIVSGIVAIFWVRSIDYMKENHPNYKGEDFLDWSDDNCCHYEGDF